MDRRRFLEHALLALPAARLASAESIDLVEATLVDLELATNPGALPLAR